MEPTHWVTDTELKEAAARFDKLMEEAIANEDDVGAVLRSHLLLERTLIEFLKERFTNPDVLDKGLSRIGYERLVELGRGLGIAQWMVPPLKKIGEIRNKTAHDISFVFSSEVALNLRGCFPTEKLDEIEKRYKGSIKELIGKPSVKDTEARVQYDMYVSTLYIDLLTIVEAIRIAKEHGR